MRSINTSLIALLPVAGLLFVGAGLLGVGTIKDLALILFVGLASGAYSSLFLATPIVVELTERTREYQGLRKRVESRRARDARRASDEAELAAAGVVTPPKRSGAPAPAPRPGARPTRRPGNRRSR
jgi:preprotein translocase subunit SecF